jgi:hypothetical protein
MKIYNPEPLKLIRVSISKANEKTQYINFKDTSHKEVIDNLIKLIDSFNLSVLNKGDRVRLDIRECLGGKNGKSKSISFIGLTVSELHEKIIKKYS